MGILRPIIFTLVVVVLALIALDSMFVGWAFDELNVTLPWSDDTGS